MVQWQIEFIPLPISLCQLLECLPLKRCDYNWIDVRQFSQLAHAENTPHHPVFFHIMKSIDWIRATMSLQFFPCPNVMIKRTHIFKNLRKRAIARIFTFSLIKWFFYVETALSGCHAIVPKTTPLHIECSHCIQHGIHFCRSMRCAWIGARAIPLWWVLRAKHFQVVERSALRNVSG